MKVHFARTRSPLAHSCVPVMVDLLANQRNRFHTGVDDPADADLVLFPDCHLLPTDWKLDEIATSDAARRFPEKVAVYDERDTPWCRFPGIYVSMPASHFARPWQVASGYYRVPDPAERLDADPSRIDQDLLASFVGGRTHRCREAVLRLGGPRIHVESPDGFVFYDPSSVAFDERRRSFAETLFRSKFVLCPRGAGTSSIRLFETLAAGRAPVVIADQWVPPAGPRWEEFAIRWPERQVDELPRVLLDAEPDAEEMGRRARAAYEEWFAPDVALTTVLDQLEARRKRPDFAGFPAAGRRDLQYLRAAAARGNARYRSWGGRLRRRLTSVTG
jgi:Exostosin family